MHLGNVTFEKIRSWEKKASRSRKGIGAESLVLMSILRLSLSIFKCDGKSVHSRNVRGFLRTKREILNRPFIRIDRDLGDCLVQTPCCTNKTRKECTLFKITQLFLAKGGLEHRSLEPILYPLPIQSLPTNFLVGAQSLRGFASISAQAVVIVRKQENMLHIWRITHRYLQFFH